MRLKLPAIVATGLVAAVAFSLPADAAKKRTTRAGYTYVQQRPAPSTVIVTRGEDGRTRTKVVVQKRSYLDGGTEVMPADNVNSFRSTFMSYRPGSAATQNTAFDRPSWVNDPFFLAGKRNPYPWLGN